MKEDIEMLEKLLKDVKQTSSYDKISHYKALENLLTRYKEERDLRIHYENSLDNMERLYIDKDKVKEKIEELKEKEELLTDEQGYWGGSDLLAQIKILQKLLD